MAFQGKLLRGVWSLGKSGTTKAVSTAGGDKPRRFLSIVHSRSVPPLLPSCATLRPASHGSNPNPNAASSSRKQDEVDAVLGVGMKLSCLRLHSGRNKQSGEGTPLSAAAWPGAGHLEYVCPSERLSVLPELAILEDTPRAAVTYDLPNTPAVISLIIDDDSPNRLGRGSEISEPENATANAPMEARKIMKIRRKKMKRHLLKKFRKRMAFTLRKIKRDRRKKKEAVVQARLAGIKDWGESFDARTWVQEELDKARKGGFYINVMAGKQ